MFFRKKILYSCNKCGDCCKDMNIPLTHYDIYRIFLTIPKIDPNEFIFLMPAYELDEFKILINNSYKIIYLNNKLFDNTCYFLKNNQCSIYDYRPFTCRNWPLTINKNDKLYIDEISQELVDKSCDKKKFTEYDTAVKKLKRSNKESFDYLLFLKDWNKKAKKTPQSFNFAFFIKTIKEKNYG